MYLDFADAIARMGREKMAERYGNLFGMYEQITAEDPYTRPMRISPAVHYTMGGLWVDYDLQTTVPGLFAIGEANFSDHGANRLGASALMQGLADGYFVLPATINDYLARGGHSPIAAGHPAVEEAVAGVEDRLNLLLAVGGDRTPDSFHRELGELMWDECGMARTEAGLRKALERIPALREEFWRRVRVTVTGTGEELNVLPQGAPERESRMLGMVDAMDEQGFGGCTNTGECATACPKGIPLPSIAAMNHEYLRAVRKGAGAR